MKNSNFFCTVCFSVALFSMPKLFAQDSFRLKINSVFQNVNKTQVPTQYLTEYSYPLLPMNKFNGVLADSNRTDITVWRMLYASLLTSYVGTTTPVFPPLSTVNTNINNIETTGTIPITLLHANYNDLRPDAVTAGLMSVSNQQIFDVAGRSQSPYRNQTVFVAAPSLSYSYDAITKFVFPANLLLKNTGTINAITVDFADGLGYRPVTLGTTMNIGYPTIGTYRVKVKITPATGAIVESWFDFEANKANCIGCRYALSREETLNDPTFLASVANGHSGGKITFIKSINNTTSRIKKPLIIAKGFDIHSSAPHLAKKRYDMNDLLFGFQIANDDGYDINGQLDDVASYDIVLINYENGTDDIRRNARLLQAVIRKINSQKLIGDSLNVVMGMSMGGLVVRFGLAQMVRNGENPQTRLAITHDSPHRGANVPLGFQFLGRHMASLNIGVGTLFGTISVRDIVPQIGELSDLLNASAAAQQLMLRATGTTTTSVVTNTFLADGGEYRTMVDNVPSQPYKIIATSNGSQCATGLFAPNSILIKGDAGGGIIQIPWVFESTIRTSIQINSAGNSTANEVLNWRFYGRQVILGISINATISRIVANGLATKPFDGAAGGTIPIINHQDKTAFWWTPTIGYSFNFTGQNDFCFIPTASALDATNFSSISLTENYVNGVNFTNPPQFPSFIAQNQFQKTIFIPINTPPRNPISLVVTAFNSRHISFYSRTSRWLFEQMENVTPSSNQECSTECGTVNGAAITGSSQVCTSSNYSLNTTSAVAWTVSPSGIATLVQNGNTATLTKVGNGSVILTANVGNCGGISVSRTITVGEIYPSFNITEIQKPCPDGSRSGIYVADVNAPVNISTYSWSCSACTFVAPYGSRNANVEIGVNFGVTYPVQFTLTAVANGQCGSSNPLSQTFTTSDASACGGGQLRMAMSPNPTTSILNVSLTNADPNRRASTNESFDVTIIDKFQKIVYNKKHLNSEIPLDVSNLPTGLYTLRVIRGTDIVTKTFSIVR